MSSSTYVRLQIINQDFYDLGNVLTWAAVTIESLKEALF